MPITETDLRGALTQAFPNGTITIDDLAGDNDHWKATIIDSSFADLNRIQQHRKVQEAVADHDIHALSIITKVE